jgi:hypothetical protein
LLGFSAVLVYTEQGMQGTVVFAAVVLTVIVVGVVLPLVLGRRLGLTPAGLVRAAFLVPGLALFWVPGHTQWLAWVVGGFIGLTWGARHWLELSLLADEQRDRYATVASATAVLSSLTGSLLASTVLSGSGESAQALYWAYAVVALGGAWWAPRSLPTLPPVGLQSPLVVVRQPAYWRALPLYFLESGLWGMAMVLGASGAVKALGVASHFGWVSSLATVLGALALLALRKQRHGGNRVRWMGGAAVGMALAHSALGASVWWAGFFVVHLLVQAVAHPFWMASEQVLNQRALDLHGTIVDRIVLRELTLWALRLLTLGVFWATVQAWPWERTLVLGAAFMASVTLLEWAVGRFWLRAG